MRFISDSFYSVLVKIIFNVCYFQGIIIYEYLCVMHCM